MQDSSDEIRIKDEERKNLKPAFFQHPFLRPKAYTRYLLNIKTGSRIPGK